MYKTLPKHKELEKQMESLRLKVIHDYEVPFETKELTQQIRKDPYFKDIYEFLTKGRIPKNDRNLGKEAQDYILIDKVLFRIETCKNTEELLPQLCIPQTYIPALLYHYHDSLLAAHQGALRMYLTLRRKFYAPHLFQNIRTYLSACYTCQVKSGPPDRQKAHHLRIPYDYRPMERVSMDVKDMPRARTGEKYLLLVCCEFTNYVVGIPMQSNNSVNIIEALLSKVVYVFGPPKQMITDQGSPLTSALVYELYEATGIDCKLVSPENHGSLRVERYIQTVGNMLRKFMTEQGADWPYLVGACCYAHNTFVSTAIGVSPYQLVFLKEPADLTNVRFEPIVTRSVGAQEYLQLLQEKFNRLRETVIARKVKDQQKQLHRQERLHLDKHVYAKGDLVYFFAPRLSELFTTSKKFQASYIGPLQIAHILDETHFLLADLQGKILKLLGGAHVNLLKPYVVTFGEMKDHQLVTYKNIEDLPKGALPTPRI
jgi:hypothetical protein